MSTCYTENTKIPDELFIFCSAKSTLLAITTCIYVQHYKKISRTQDLKIPMDFEMKYRIKKISLLNSCCLEHRPL